MSAGQTSDPRVERALFGLDHLERDEARAALIRGGDAREVAQVVEALTAPLDVTRRRAARLLAELPPQRALPQLEARLSTLSASPQWPTLREPLILIARLITTLSEAPSELLSSLTRHPVPKVRRAALSPVTSDQALCEALEDERPEVIERAAELCLKRSVRPALESISLALERSPELPALRRLLAQAHPRSALMQEAAQAGDPLALRSSLDLKLLCSLLLERLPEAASDPEAHAQCLSAAWRLPQLLAEGVYVPSEPSHAHDAEQSEALDEALKALSSASLPAFRMAAARARPLKGELLSALRRDPDLGVRWLAERSSEGAYQPEVLAGRLGPHERLSSPSARPPYGLRPFDELPTVPRVRAALALCNARFDVNVGVAMRSAEAAGFERLFLIGERALSLSPTRGAELAIPLEVLPDPQSMIERARALGYQPVAVQQTPDSQPYHLAAYPPRPLFILGSEDAGLPDALRWAADLVVEIPLFGLIDSLNVATAATCVIMHWRVHHSPEPSEG